MEGNDGRKDAVRGAEDKEVEIMRREVLELKEERRKMKRKIKRVEKDGREKVRVKGL